MSASFFTRGVTEGTRRASRNLALALAVGLMPIEMPPELAVVIVASGLHYGMVNMGRRSARALVVLKIG